MAIARVFLAFGSKDKTLAATLKAAAEAASRDGVQYIAWSAQDASGTPVRKQVHEWITECEAAAADISLVNDNVTYEIGFVIGAGKDLRLIRNTGHDDKELREIGLLDGLIWDGYKTRADLDLLLGGKSSPKNKWASAKRDIKQPIYVVSPSTPNMVTTKLFSAVKKQTRFKFRSFKSWEIGRLSAHEAWEQVALSSGVVVTWEEGDGLEIRRSNQRAAFVYGLARGRGIPALLIAQKRAVLPADLQEQAVRWSDLHQIDNVLRDFRDDVQDELYELEEEQQLPIALLDSIDCGDAAAENEQDRLKRYFLETEEFKHTLNGDANLIVGRKGSGKSAIFLQTRDRMRIDKKNIVVDLNPEGYQLIKLKELLLELQSQGTRKEFIAAFWQYVLWLEIAYKILEKDERLARRDSFLGERYAKLEQAFRQRVDTGAGDFSERLRLLTEMIGRRFSERRETGTSVLNSSEVLEIVYGADIAGIRDEVLSYLNMKGKVLFLFDNLDRMRTPSGFNDDDALVIVGLVESLQEISKKFRRAQIDFTWVLFIRSDVYAFVVSTMADYGKLSQQVLEWNDRELLKKVLQKRILDSAPSSERGWEKTWEAISVPRVNSQDTMAFLVDSSLMRPRYLIRLFETAKRRAVNMGHQRIQEDDYLASLEELGWTVMEDLDRELADLVSNGESLLFDIAHLDRACGLEELRAAVEQRVGATDFRERAIDVLLWGGAIGIDAGDGPKFIFDCGYKLQYLRSLMTKQPDLEVCLHPTLRRLFTSAD